MDNSVQIDVEAILAAKAGKKARYVPRFVVSYPDSLIIMTNPFARYDKETMSSPAGVDGKFYSPNTATTVLYNIVVGILIVLVVLLYMKILKRWKTR